MTYIRFPEGFVWAAGTSAYQVEGSPLADGAGASIQHRFAHTPGNTFEGATGDVGADHYRRYEQDVQLMAELGLPAYQFSIAWPRVLPEGTGPVNGRGLAFYDALVDRLLEAGIAPMPTLHHWDLPSALMDRGGWMNRDCAEWFGEYTAVVFDALGDRVSRWLTICEPFSIAHAGHVAGKLAPAMCDLYAGLRAAHHVNLAHGRAVEAFRASGSNGEIGTSTLVADVEPASDSEADAAAARRTAAYVNALYLDPIILGEYPAELETRLGEAWPDVLDGDLATISTPIDFIGMTYYFGFVVGDAAHGERGEGATSDFTLDPGRDMLARVLDVSIAPAGGWTTAMGWPIDPEGLSRALRWVRGRYGDKPIFITENGASFPDSVAADGRVDDQERLAFIRDHLVVAQRSIAEGVDLRGWVVWSLLDTWEFSSGYRHRFGLIHVDYETQRRTVKASGHWYREVIAKNGFEVE